MIAESAHHNATPALEVNGPWGPYQRWRRTSHKWWVHTPSAGNINAKHSGEAAKLNFVYRNWAAHTTALTHRTAGLTLTAAEAQPGY